MWKYKVTDAQLVFFSERFSYKNPVEFIGKLKKIYPNGIQNIPPYAEDVTLPAEISRMAFGVQDDFDCSFSLNRIDLKNKLIKKEDGCKTIIDNAIKIFDILKETGNARLTNIGLIIKGFFGEDEEKKLNINLSWQRIFSLSEDSSKKILSYEMDSELTIRNLRKDTITIVEDDIKINYIFEVTTAALYENKRVISLNFDINTFPEDILITEEGKISLIINQIWAKHGELVESIGKELDNGEGLDK